SDRIRSLRGTWARRLTAACRSRSGRQRTRPRGGRRVARVRGVLPGHRPDRQAGRQRRANGRVVNAPVSFTTDWSGDPSDTSDRRWNGAWPLKWPEVAMLLTAYVAVVALWTLVGRIYTDWTAP